MIQILNKKLSFKNDLGITIFNGFLVIIGIFLLNGYIARVLGIEYLGEYLLLRTVVLSIIGVLLIGINISLPTFIAKGKDHTSEATLIIFLCISLPLIFIYSTMLKFNLIGNFTNVEYFSFNIFIIGIGMQFTTYGLYRGHMNMVAANIIHFVCSALLPITVFMLKPDLNSAIKNMGLFLVLFNGIFFLVKNGKPIIKISTINRVKELLRFGFVRMPSIFSQYILLAVIPILISKNNNFSEVAYYTASLSIFRSSLIIVGPIGILLLPRVANAVEVGKNSNVKASLEVLLEMVILFSLIVSVSMNLFSREIMVLWLGEVSAVGVWIIKTLILFLPLYLIIEILRSPIDAMSDKGVNSIIYTLAAIILLVSYYIMIRLGFTEVKSGVFSFGCAQLVACVSSYLAVKNKFKISLPNRIFFVVCVLCGALLIIFYKIYNFFFDSGLILIILYAITTFVIISIVLKQFAKQWRIRIKL